MMTDFRHPVLSEELVRHLVDKRGRLDNREKEQIRGEIFSVEASLDSLVPWIRYVEPIENKHALVFGTGNGGTAVACALAGMKVTGIDINENAVETTMWRAFEYRVSESISLFHRESTFPLPFSDASFDIGLMADVIEHIVDERGKYIREVFRTLRPGGLLVITGTPNLLYPKDVHTTGLFLVPWLPSRVAQSYAILRRRWKRGANLDYAGRRGATYWQIIRWLEKAHFRVLNLKPCFTSEYLESHGRINTAQRKLLFQPYRECCRIRVGGRRRPNEEPQSVEEVALVFCLAP